MGKVFTLELIRTRKQMNTAPAIEVYLNRSLEWEKTVGVHTDIENFIRVYGVDELASSLMNERNHYITSQGIELDVIDVFNDGKKVTILLEGGPIGVRVTTPGRLSVQALVD